MNFIQKYLKYKYLYKKGGKNNSENCNLFKNEIYTICPNNDSMYYHGMSLIMYLILLLNSYMLGKSEIIFPRLLNIISEIIYVENNNQNTYREDINNCNNYTDLYDIFDIKEHYSKKYKTIEFIDNLPIFKDHLLSVTNSNFKDNLEQGESFIGAYYKNEKNILQMHIKILISLITYFIPDTKIDKKVINNCVNIIKISINECLCLVSSIDEDINECSLYGIVLCITPISLNNGTIKINNK
jgi:hypothetical protein